MARRLASGVDGGSIDGDVKRVDRAGFDRARVVGHREGGAGGVWFPRALDEGAVASVTLAELLFDVVVGRCSKFPGAELFEHL